MQPDQQQELHFLEITILFPVNKQRKTYHLKKYLLHTMGNYLPETIKLPSKIDIQHDQQQQLYFLEMTILCCAHK